MNPKQEMKQAFKNNGLYPVFSMRILDTDIYDAQGNVIDSKVTGISVSRFTDKKDIETVKTIFRSLGYTASCIDGCQVYGSKPYNGPLF